MDNSAVEAKENGLPSCAFVLFGATGDLTKRKIMPGLFSLSAQGLLPKKFVVVAFARRDKNDEVYRAELRENMKEFAPKLPLNGAEWDRFAENVFYVRSEFDDADGYKRLADRLTELDVRLDLGGSHLFYLATPPDNFSEIIENLGKARLDRPRREHGPRGSTHIRPPFRTRRHRSQCRGARSCPQSPPSR